MTNDQFTEWLESQIEGLHNDTIYWSDPLAVFEKVLSEFRCVELAPTWIPVTPETMPDTTAEVLVHTNTGAVKEAWCMDGVWYSVEPYDLPIKHWQKKPAPPQNKQQ